MQTRGVIRTVFVALALQVFIGCSSLNERQLIGTYKAEVSCVTISLVLRQDFSFTQTVRTSTGGFNELEGTWSLDRKTNSLSFTPFLDFIDNTSGKRVRSSIFSPERIAISIALGPIIVKCPDSNAEVNYIK